MSRLNGKLIIVSLYWHKFGLFCSKDFKFSSSGWAHYVVYLKVVFRDTHCFSNSLYVISIFIGCFFPCLLLELGFNLFRKQHERGYCLGLGHYLCTENLWHMKKNQWAELTIIEGCPLMPGLLHSMFMKAFQFAVGKKIQKMVNFKKSSLHLGNTEVKVTKWRCRNAVIRRSRTFIASVGKGERIKTTDEFRIRKTSFCLWSSVNF